MREQLETQMREYEELMGVKVELDQEIATYRTLLESEETRYEHCVLLVSLCPLFSADEYRGASRRAAACRLNLTPARDEPEGPSAKRRRTGTASESSQGNMRFAQRYAHCNRLRV